jgi:hypothetical protein
VIKLQPPTLPTTTSPSSFRLLPPPREVELTVLCLETARRR